MAQMRKCKIESSLSIKPCDGLLDAMGRAMTRHQGVSLAQFASLETGKHTRQEIVLKNGAKDRGMMFNYCPFCGADLDTRSKVM